MDRQPLFSRWLPLAALLDWSVLRTFTRMVIFMPKSELFIQVYLGLNWLGQLAATTAGLLAILGLGWVAWRSYKERDLFFFLVCNLLLVASLVFLRLPATGALLVGFQGLLAAGVANRLWRAWDGIPRWNEKTPLLLVGLALLASQISLLASSLVRTSAWSDFASPSQIVFYLGEALVLVSAASLWVLYGQGASLKTWGVAGLVTFAFTLPRLLNPSMTGILTIWSTGLTLYLPWPAYTASLWLASTAVFHSLKHRQPAGWAILLLAAGGYAPQLSVHAFYGLLAYAWLVEGKAGPALPELRYNHPMGAPAIPDGHTSPS